MGHRSKQTFLHRQIYMTHKQMLDEQETANQNHNQVQIHTH